MKKFSFIVFSIIIFQTAGNITFSQDVVDATTLNNKIMAGYQGWFAASGDGSGYGWIHWSRGEKPAANNITIDYWPDMREFDDDELFETSFVYPDLRNAGLYSAYTKKTVDHHVKWMKDYGIDGVFVQRFLGSAAIRRDLRDTVLQNVRNAAEKYGRVFANMYDISGGDASNMVEFIKNDWMHLVDDLKILESSRYLKHNGRPVLSIWGFGFDDRPGTPAIADELIQWFTVDAPEKYRVTLKAGIDDKWQNHSSEWQAIYEKFDILSPWAVGRYRTTSSADNFRKDRIEPDLERTSSKNIDYMPVVFPGFSWWNLKDGGSTFNSIPREGGKFLWHQFYNAIDAGCNMVYVAMYDEVDEGTAIYKLAENEDQIPTKGRFVTLDIDGYKIPSDWYLRLTGEATKMLRGEISVIDTIPIAAYPNSAEFIDQVVPTNMVPGSSTDVTLTFKNTGTTSWSQSGNYLLVDAIDSSLSKWGISGLDFEVGEIIAPGEEKTFSFQVAAPLSEGVYEFKWKLLQEGEEWIDDPSEKRLVNVSETPDFFDDCDVLDEWTSSSTLSINSTENIQGDGCIEFSGSAENDIEFEKTFGDAYDSGLTPYEATLQCWYYISDPTLQTDGLSIYLGSGETSSGNAYSWQVSDLSAGWNLLTLHVSDAIVTGAPDLGAINWLSFSGEKTGNIISRIDEIQLFDRYSGQTKYDLVVNNGTGSGKYPADAIVTVEANEAPDGSEFVGWKVISGNPLLENDVAMSSLIRVRDSDVEITAEYKQLGKYLDDCDNLYGWGGSGPLVMNEIDQKEGSGCIEFFGDQTDEFKKAFDVPFNSGVSVESGKLEFWYYVTDASMLGTNNQLELGSAGQPDQREYHWNLSGLTDGWNFISVSFSNANISGNAPDLSAINWFRLYNFKSGPVTSRIDAIEIVDPEAGDKYPLTVRLGEGDGSFYNGTEVLITADPAPDGQQFDQWIIIDGNPVIEDAFASSTNVTTGTQAAVVEATFKVKEVSVNRFEAEDELHIYPNPANISINVELNLHAQSEVDIILMDLSGRIVEARFQNHMLMSGRSVLRIPVENITSGLYILKTEINGNPIAKTVIIEH